VINYMCFKSAYRHFGEEDMNHAQRNRV